MKNMFKIFLALALLVAANSNAKTQAIITGTDATPFTVHASGKFDVGGYSVSKDDHGMGIKSLAGNLGLAHYVGHDFEYGINVFGGWATSLQGKLFAETGKRDGFKTGVNLSGRYMPHVTSSIRLGGLVSVGYSRLFGQGDKPMHESFAFGDANFDVGPSFMHQATDSFAWGFGITYGMTEMRFGSAKASDIAKQYSNLHTFRVPFDFVLQATDSLGVTLALDPAWRNLGGSHKFYHGFFYDVVAGVNIAL